MHPVICKIGPISIYSYGLMLVIGFMISTFLASRQARKENINPEIIFNLAFVAFISGVIGARIFYVAENWRYYFERPVEILMLQNGGLSWFGGLILGFTCAVLYLRKEKESVLKVLDVIAPFLALAQALGRLGCALNGCCFGKESHFGIYFPVHDAVLIPTQLYSSLILLGIYIVLRFFQVRPHGQGRIFFLYLLLYSVKRFFIEFYRADNPVIFLGLTLFQILSIAVFFVAIFALFLPRKDSKST